MIKLNEARKLLAFSGQLGPLKTTSQAASLAITSTRILVAVEICSSPALVRYQALQNLLPDILLVLGGDALLAPLLNRRKPVLEGVHVAWRSAFAF
jgi:hypothetical protein